MLVNVVEIQSIRTWLLNLVVFVYKDILHTEVYSPISICKEDIICGVFIRSRKEKIRNLIRLIEKMLLGIHLERNKNHSLGNKQLNLIINANKLIQTNMKRNYKVH